MINISYLQCTIIRANSTLMINKNKMSSSLFRISPESKMEQ